MHRPIGTSPVAESPQRHRGGSTASRDHQRCMVRPPSLPHAVYKAHPASSKWRSHSLRGLWWVLHDDPGFGHHASASPHPGCASAPPSHRKPCPLRATRVEARSGAGDQLLWYIHSIRMHSCTPPPLCHRPCRQQPRLQFGAARGTERRTGEGGGAHGGAHGQGLSHAHPAEGCAQSARRHGGSERLRRQRVQDPPCEPGAGSVRAYDPPHQLASTRLGHATRAHGYSGGGAPCAHAEAVGCRCQPPRARLHARRVRTHCFHALMPTCTSADKARGCVRAVSRWRRPLCPQTLHRCHHHPPVCHPHPAGTKP